MSKIINKIAFLVHEPLLYDHWVGVWRLLDRKRFEIVLVDAFRGSKNEHFGRSSEEFISLITKQNYKYQFVEDVIAKNIKYNFVISNQHVQGSTMLSNPRPPFKLMLKNQVKTILNLILKIFKSKKSYILETYAQHLPLRIGNKQIRFMYGADINDGWSLARWNELYDIFLCHGPNDARAINSRFRGKTIQIGYPRYDDYFNIPNIGEDLKKIFSCDPEKKTVLWLPTAGVGTCSIPYYAEQISQLLKSYNVIVRPHPITFRKTPSNISILEDLHFKIDDDSLRDMNALYKVADFVVCDYGGTQFSALYLDKNIILLNTPEADEFPTSKDSSDLELRRELSPVLDIEDAKNLNNILHNESIWIRQAEQRKIIFNKYFAPYQGNSAKRVASVLYDLMANCRSTVIKK